jgi:hypothetical protein
MRSLARLSLTRRSGDTIHNSTAEFGMVSPELPGDLTSGMPERARTDLWEPRGSNPLERPGPERPPDSRNAASRVFHMTYVLGTRTFWGHHTQCDRRIRICSQRSGDTIHNSTAEVGMVSPELPRSQNSVWCPRNYPVLDVGIGFDLGDAPGDLIGNRNVVPPRDRTVCDQPR